VGAANRAEVAASTIAAALETRGRSTMNRNMLYLVIGALAVLAIIVGYMLYQEQQKTGIEIDLGNGGISIETQ
jgi:hypothetical protein